MSAMLFCDLTLTGDLDLTCGLVTVTFKIWSELYLRNCNSNSKLDFYGTLSQIY